MQESIVRARYASFPGPAHGAPPTPCLTSLLGLTNFGHRETIGYSASFIAPRELHMTRRNNYSCWAGKSDCCGSTRRFRFVQTPEPRRLDLVLGTCLLSTNSTSAWLGRRTSTFGSFQRHLSTAASANRTARSMATVTHHYPHVRSAAKSQSAGKGMGGGFAAISLSRHLDKVPSGRDYCHVVYKAGRCPGS
jgi:hypothetical protein